MNVLLLTTATAPAVIMSAPARLPRLPLNLRAAGIPRCRQPAIHAWYPPASTGQRRARCVGERQSLPLRNIYSSRMTPRVICAGVVHERAAVHQDARPCAGEGRKALTCVARDSPSQDLTSKLACVHQRHGCTGTCPISRAGAQNVLTATKCASRTVQAKKDITLTRAPVHGAYLCCCSR